MHKARSCCLAIALVVFGSLTLPSFASASSQEEVYQQAMALFEQTLDDPDASPEAKEQAREGMAQVQQDLENLRSLSQQQTSRGDVQQDPSGYAPDDSRITSSSGRDTGYQSPAVNGNGR